MTELVALFSLPNEVDSEALTTDGRLARLALTRQDLPVVIPWIDGIGGRRWYIVGHHSQAEWLREETIAAVGVSFTDFSGQAAVLDAGDLGDAAIGSRWPDAWVARVGLINLEALPDVNAPLESTANRWASNFVPDQQDSGSLQQLLRLFYLAVQTGSRSDASTALTDIRRRTLLAPVNCLYLELEFLSTFDGPEAVLGHPRALAVLRLRRPAMVSDLLARAVVQVLLRPDMNGSVSEIQERFRAEAFGYRNLITSVGECRSTAGVLMLALRRLELGSDADAIDPACFNFPLDTTTVKLLGLDHSASFRGSGELTDRSERFRAMLDRGEFDQIIALAGEEPIDRVSLEAAMLAAREIDSIAAAMSALELLKLAPPEVRDAISKDGRFGPVICEFQSLRGAVEEPVTRWAELLDQMLKVPDWLEVETIARHGATEWQLDELGSVQADSGVSELLERLRREQQGALARIMPSFTMWLLRATSANPEYTPVFSLSAAIAELCQHEQTRSSARLIVELFGRIGIGSIGEVQIERLCGAIRKGFDGRRPEGIFPSAVVLAEILSPRLQRSNYVDITIGILLQPPETGQSHSRPGVARWAETLHSRMGGPEISLKVRKLREYKVSVLVCEKQEICTDMALVLGEVYPNLTLKTNGTDELDDQLIGDLQAVDLAVIGWTCPVEVRNAVMRNRDQGRAMSFVARSGTAELINEIERLLEDIG